MKLTQQNIEIVRSTMKGAKLAKFNESVGILEASLAQNGWITGGSRSAHKGFGQGSGINYNPRWNFSPEHPEDFNLGMCMVYGSANIITSGAIDRMFASGLVKKKFTRQYVEAWIAVCKEAYEASEYLTGLRPAPVITAIGLSPKVTATLTEMNLDIKLPSIKMARIAYRKIPAFGKDGQPLLNRFGQQIYESIPYVDWTPGTKFGRSRFSYGCKCEACGKSIPSGMFVPIEADDQKSGDHIGMWIGCDCARNIFGIKDIGVEKPTQEIA